MPASFLRGWPGVGRLSWDPVPREGPHTCHTLSPERRAGPHRTSRWHKRAGHSVRRGPGPGEHRGRRTPTPRGREGPWGPRGADSSEHSRKGPTSSRLSVLLRGGGNPGRAAEAARLQIPRTRCLPRWLRGCRGFPEPGGACRAQATSSRPKGVTAECRTHRGPDRCTPFPGDTFLAREVRADNYGFRAPSPWTGASRTQALSSCACPRHRHRHRGSPCSARQVSPAPRQGERECR